MRPCFQPCPWRELDTTPPSSSPPSPQCERGIKRHPDILTAKHGFFVGGEIWLAGWMDGGRDARYVILVILFVCVWVAMQWRGCVLWQVHVNVNVELQSGT